MERSKEEWKNSIEWNYGHQAPLFPYHLCENKLKLMESELVTEICTVTTLLHNFHSAFEGCNTSNYFNVYLPKKLIDHFIDGTDIIEF